MSTLRSRRGYASGTFRNPYGMKPVKFYMDDLNKKSNPTYLERVTTTIVYACRQSHTQGDVARDNKMAKNKKQYSPRGRVIRQLKSHEQRLKLAELIKNGANNGKV